MLADPRAAVPLWFDDRVGAGLLGSTPDGGRGFGAGQARSGRTGGLIINRYLVRELSRPLVAILGILVALFGSYTAAGFLSDAVNGLLPAGAIAELIGLKLLISLEVLIPAALYASVLLAFARLSGESEFAAMYSIRMTPGTLVRAVLTLAGALAAVVAVLSLVVRPIAYRALHAVSDRAATLLDIDAMEAGSFYVAEDGGRVIFLGHRPGRGATARDVFVRIRHADHTEIVHARLANELRTKTLARGADIYLTDAHVYEIDRSRGRPDQVVEAQGLVVSPNPGHGAARGYSAVAAGTGRLAGSRDDADIAELQWRLSTPVSTLLLGLLAIPLSRTAPRQGQSSRLGRAILVYFGYYLLCTSARTWVQHGAIGRFPGIWWAPALLALLCAATLYPHHLGLAPRRRSA